MGAHVYKKIELVGRVFSLINVLAEGCGLPESHTDPSFPKKISSVLLSRRVI